MMKPMTDGRRLALIVAVNLLVGLGAAADVTALILLAGVAIPVGWAILHRPQIGILLLVAGLPYSGLLLILPLPGAVADWASALLVATLVASLIAPAEATAGDGIAHRPERIPSWLLTYAGLFALTVAAIPKVTSLEAAYGMRTMFLPVAAAVVVLRTPLNGRERDRLVSILMVNGFVTAAFGIFQQFVGHEYLASMGYAYNSTIRFSGSFVRSFSTFNQPFGFAFFLVLVVLLGVSVALSDPGRARNRTFLFLLPVYGLGLLSAIVRSAWIAVALGLLYLAVTRYRILLLAMAVAAVGLLVVPTGNSSNITSSRSASARTESWVSNLPELFDHPLGVGPGRVGAAAGAINRELGGPRGFQQEGLDAETGGAYQPDNQYFKVALELGLPGLYLFAATMVISILTCHRVASRRGGEPGALGAGAAAYFLGLSVACFSTMIYELPATDTLLWIVLAVVTTVAAPASARPPVPTLPAAVALGEPARR